MLLKAKAAEVYIQRLLLYLIRSIFISPNLLISKS